MPDWISATPAERRLLPGGRLQGPTPYVIAIMMFVMVVIAAAGLSLANAAAMVAKGVENRYSVQIANGATRVPRVCPLKGPSRARISSRCRGLRSPESSAKAAISASPIVRSPQARRNPGTSCSNQ